MNLPPKAIAALIDIKKELLSTETSVTHYTETEQPKPKAQPKRAPWMRRAPRPNAFQKMCQRHDRW